MSPLSGPGPRLRALLLWTTVTLGQVGVALLTVPAALTAASDFPGLLVRGCAAAALLAGLALWAVTTDVAAAVLRGRLDRPDLRRPGPVRAALLAACGIAVLSSPTATHASEPGPPPTTVAAVLAATATAAQEKPGSRDESPLDGLPLPGRPGSEEPSRPGPAATPEAVTVQPGDSLWRIASAALPDADLAEVADYVAILHDHNRRVIGDDPHLIHPGQRLELPPTGRNDR